jgi:hypothetical protein
VNVSKEVFKKNITDKMKTRCIMEGRVKMNGTPLTHKDELTLKTS